MTSFQDKILLAFIDKRTRVLKDSDLTNALVNQGIPCTTDDIRRHVQSLSPSLFQLIFNDDRSLTIRAEPKIEICEEFLGNRCKAEDKSCNKLHMCRHIDTGCTTSNCRFPHDFSRGINRKILAQHHCEQLNAATLVKFLRMKTSAARTQRPRGGGGRNRRRRGPQHRPRQNGPQMAAAAAAAQNNDIDLQVDVSYPSVNRANQIDMEIIRMLLLNHRDIKVDDVVEETENDYCRRATIQLEKLSDVEKLLESPIINHDGIDIKFKRSKQTVDRTSFILKTSIKNERDKIESERIRLYAKTLIGMESINNIIDRSTDTDQVVLVECAGEIDFNKVRHEIQSRPKLKERDIALSQIYECDVMEIQYKNRNESMNEDSLRGICRTTWKHIFAYHFPTESSAEIEFINSQACAKWRSSIAQIAQRFNLTINPILIEADDQNEDTTSNFSLDSYTKSRQAKIRLHPEWEIIANHRKFKNEYKDFIRKELGGDIDINDDEAIYNGPFPAHVRDATDELVFLGNKTDDFMKNFQCETFRELNKGQILILQGNSAHIAYTLTKENEYLVATRINEMHGLKRKLFSEKDPIIPPPLMNLTHHETRPPIRPGRPNQFSRPGQNNNHGGPPPRPPTVRAQRQQGPRPTTPQLKTQPSEPGQTRRSDTLTRYDSCSSLPVTTSSGVSTSTYSVIDPAQLNMFTINKFEERLQQSFQNTFNVKLYCERIQGARTTIRIKVTGQTEEVENAIFDLTNLFGAVCTKTYDEKNDGSWTKIEDATQVIQYHFMCADYICLCQQTSPTIISVYYFHTTNPQFGIDEEKIDGLIKNQFITATIPYKVELDIELHV